MLSKNTALNVVQTAIDKVFYAEFDYDAEPGLATARTDSVFKQETIDRAALITQEYKGPGYFSERGDEEEIEGATVESSNQKTHSVLNYDKGIYIPKTFFDDELHMLVRNTVQKFARNARLSQDRNAFKTIFNLGFTTTTTSDGVALFSNSHTALNGDTVDNLETGTLTEANLDTLVQKLLTQVTQDGTIGGHVPAVLLVPPALFKTAQEITKSELRSGTANNDLNYYSQIYPGLQVYQSPFLSAAQGGSDTAYFLLSRNHSVMRIVREGINTNLLGEEFDPAKARRYYYSAGYREVVSPISWEGIVASNGTV